MPTMKGTMFFEYRRWGWSESYYFDGDHQQAMNALFAVALGRSQVMHSSVVIKYLRVSDISIRGDAWVDTRIIEGNKPLSASSDVEDPWTSLLIRRSSGANYFSNMYLRGMPDYLVEHGTYFPAANFEQAFAEFTGAITNNFAKIKVRSRAQPQIHQYVPITHMDIVRATSRKTGRPFGSPRGRRTR